VQPRTIVRRLRCLRANLINRTPSDFFLISARVLRVGFRNHINKAAQIVAGFADLYLRFAQHLQSVASAWIPLAAGQVAEAPGHQLQAALVFVF